MTIVVNCPKCQAKLRGPEGLAGKTVRCKGCQEKFRVPGDDPAPGSPADTQQLSVIQSAAAMPAVTVPRDGTPLPAVKKAAVPLGTPDNPLPLDDRLLNDTPRPARLLPPMEAVAAADLVEEPAGRADPFSFDAPPPGAGKKRRRRDDDADEDRPRRPRNADDADEGRPKKRGYQTKAGPPWGILIGVGVLLLAVGGGVAAVLIGGGGKKEEAKAKPDSPPPEAKAKPTPKGAEKKDAKGAEPKRGTGSDPNPEDLKPTPPGAARPPTPPAEVPPKAARPAAKLPDPPTGEPTLVGKAKRQVTIDVPADKVRDVRVTGTSLTVAFNSQPGFQGVGEKDTVRQYSLATGAKGRQFEIDTGGLGWPRAFAVSTSDGLAAVECGGSGKVTVFDFETGTTLLDKHDAFAGTPDRVGPIAALALGANRTLFVVDQAGAVDVWDLATRNRTATGTPPKRTAAGKPAAKACVMSAGAALAVALDGKVWAVTADGATAGNPVSLPDPNAVVLAMGSGAGLDRVAVAYKSPGGSFGVAAVHPAAGEVEYHALLPDGAGSPVAIGWPADTLLAVATAGDAGFIVDTEQRAVTAYLKATAGKAALFPTGGELCWLLAHAADPKKATVQSVEMPFDGYFDVAKQATKTRPVFLVPRGDGLAR